MLWFGMAWFGMAWIVMGLITLVGYWRTWTDKPPLWFCPVIVLLWPAAWWSDGIIHPLR